MDEGMVVLMDLLMALSLDNCLVLKKVTMMEIQMDHIRDYIMDLRLDSYWECQRAASMVAWMVRMKDLSLDRKLKMKKV